MKLPEELRNGKVAAGIIPVGTGNDFLRNFGTEKEFLDIDRQLKGNTVYVDLMRYERSTTDENGISECITSYGANMFNIGFDCQVVVKVNELRGRPLMNKSFAYPIGVAITLIKLPHTRLKVTFDDGSEYEGKYLLTLAANGSYCGGGFYAASQARPDDGIIDVMMIDPMGRLKFISIVGKYKKGKLLGTPLADKILKLKKCRSVKIEAADEKELCVDGEIERFRAVNIESVPGAFCFIVPYKL
jgi:diacylglycerol kinase family enzyme